MTAWPLLTPRPSLHLALKDFFEPLRTNDPRTDFFATYRKESADFDRDYARKYDEDLNTSLIFVSDPIQIHPLSTYSRGDTGRFIFCSQFRVHNRCPIKARARPERDDRRLHANPHPHREQLPLPQRGS